MCYDLVIQPTAGFSRNTRDSTVSTPSVPSWNINYSTIVLNSTLETQSSTQIFNITGRGIIQHYKNPFKL